MTVTPVQNKVDISAMSEQDQKAFKMYGKVPGKNLFTKMQKERKYFDSGDYMMSKAGVQSAQAPGTAHPTPEAVPHASPPAGHPQGILSSSPTGNALPSPAHEGHSPTSEKPSFPGVGVGISPAATSEAIEMPGHHRHQRRGSESGNHPRISPPGTIRENSQSSSFPIHHPNPGGYGSSPVKASSLAKRLDEEAEL
ncbi:uncharacterized protein IL334_002618 [Kwoniella shivajii]|uniref:mRNA stability protein n=1 Tax=Kwoniella shivajii TaxID=564305 RepID=A0ABZ1CVA0_9TREE|nr:hypothetical protein IL334_002618 [Kwoniella shivajii]